MPRGGGFRGGGFRGGGFGGGGFRGGGFRGGPGGFRTGRGSTGGRPFGRTGARRTVGRGPRGPYSHAYNRPHRRYYYYHWHYHPWYYRWWYSPYWSGYYYRPWYYSPVYVGGGIFLAIVLALILLPIAGVAIWYPFSEADTEGTVNYRSTEDLYFNEFWYEYEYTEEGNEITFTVQSTPAKINFAIWDRPFEDLPTRRIHLRDVGPINVQSGQYQFVSLFLRPESLIQYDFNSSGLVDFFIADGYDMYDWNQGGSPSFYVYEQNTNSKTDMLVISEAQDYYVVWNNEGGTSVNVDFTVDFSAEDVVVFTETDWYLNQTDFIDDTFTVPNSGNWYFFVYFDPMNSLDESTTITFDVSYDTGYTSVERWIDVQWILIIFLVIIVILIIAAILARNSQKKTRAKAPKEPTPTAPPTEKPAPVVSKCTRCGTTLKPKSIFCHKCGGKIEGRQIGKSMKTTPANAKSCSLCGSKLTGTEKFCKWCGTKIEQ